jgi:DNA-binding TFAR19-related protein (PDSD5 family)
MENVRVKHYNNKLVSIASIDDLTDPSAKPYVLDPEFYRIILAIPSRIFSLFKKVMEPGTAIHDNEIFEILAQGDLIEEYKVEIPKIYMISAGGMARGVVALIENSRGGLDIYGTYSSLPHNDKKDSKVFFYVSFDGEKARFACSCGSMLRGGLPCGHIVSILTSMAIAPEVIKRIYKLSSGNEIDDTIVSNIISLDRERINKGGVGIYTLAVLTNLLKNASNKIEVYRLKPQSIDVINDIINSRTINHLGRYIAPTGVEKPIEQVTSIKNVIDFRNKVVSNLYEYGDILAYALTAGLNHGRPPVSVWVVGNPGSFKTYGAALLSSLVNYEEIVAEFRGSKEDIWSKYRMFLDYLRSYGIEYGEGVEGGVVRRLQTTEGSITISIPLHRLIEHLRQANAIQDDAIDHKAIEAAVSRVSEDLKRMGFTTQVMRYVETPYMLDLTRVSSIDMILYRYKKDPLFQFIRSSEAFSTQVVLVDESMRNPDTINRLLTITSVPMSPDIGARVFIFTDNPAPAARALTDEGQAFRDRVIMVYSSDVEKNRDSFGEMLSMPRIGWRDLYVASRHIERVVKNFPDDLWVLGLVSYYALTYRYRVTIVKDRSSSKDISFLSPIPRIYGERERDSSVVIDPLTVYSSSFGTIMASPNRFMDHVVWLASYYSVVKGKSIPDIDDLADAIRIAVRSHVTADISNIDQFYVLTGEIASSVAREILGKAEEVIERFNGIANEDWANASVNYENALREVSSKRYLAPAITAAVAMRIAKRDIDKSVENSLLYASIELMKQKKVSDVFRDPDLSEILSRLARHTIDAQR